MLVHKATMGVLVEIYTGEVGYNSNGCTYPVYRAPTLEDVDDPDEWWEVPPGTAFSKTLAHYYPNLIPITDENGQLIGVKRMDLIERQKRIAETKKAVAAEKEAALKQTGYKKVRSRARNIMPGLKIATDNEVNEMLDNVFGKVVKPKPVPKKRKNSKNGFK